MKRSHPLQHNIAVDIETGRVWNGYGDAGDVSDDPSLLRIDSDPVNSTATGRMLACGSKKHNSDLRVVL